MEWNYTGQPFSDTPQGHIDTVRFLVGDTDESDQQLDDGEIRGLLFENNEGLYQAAIEAAESLSARYTRLATKSSADLSIQLGDRADQYAKLAKRLSERMFRHQSAIPYLGGMSKSDMEADRTNDDLTKGFSVGMHDDRDNGTDVSSSEGFTQIVPG